MARFVLFALVAAAILTAITFVIRRMRAVIYQDDYHEYGTWRFGRRPQELTWINRETGAEPLFASEAQTDPFWVEDVRTIPVR